MSAREKQKKQSQRNPSLHDDDRLLFCRADVARMYGISIGTVIRLEIAGKLKPLKLGPEQNRKTFYRSCDVRNLAGLEVA
jgi:hypothetical protein